MQQKITAHISLQNNIPAFNGTGVIPWTHPVYEVTEDYLVKMFPKKYHYRIADMKKQCKKESKLLIYASSLGTFGKAHETDISR